MPIQTQTVPPFSGGMNLEVDPWGLDDGQCHYAQDILWDKPSIARRRGPIKQAVSVSGGTFAHPASANQYAVGIIGCRQPNAAETWRIATLKGAGVTGDAKLRVFSNDYTSTTDVDLGSTATFNEAIRYATSFSAHPRGGVIFGSSAGFTGSGQQILGHWAGAIKATNEGPAGTIDAVNGSASITGHSTAFTTELEEGCMLFATPDIQSGNKTFIGIVASIASDTSLTLVDGALFDATGAAYKMRATRPLQSRIAKGLITTSKTSKVVTGSNTKFRRQGMGTASNSGWWAIFRADDMKYIGKVDKNEDGSVGGVDYDDGIASDTQLILTANASINCNKDKFVAIDIFDNNDYVGQHATEAAWLSARWANRQWYANRRFTNKNQPYSRSRVWFSDTVDPEALDCTADGDHILIGGEKAPIRPITGLGVTPAALAVFKEEETYGIFGTDETNFQVRKVLDDGCIFNPTVRPYEGGIIWAGKKGVWYWDGSEDPFNLIGDRYQREYEAALTYAPDDNTAAWGMVHRNHYFLFVEKAAPEHGPIMNDNDPNSVGDPEPYLAIVINLNTRAMSTLTNFSFQGSFDPPYESSFGTLFLVNHVNTSNVIQQAHICQADDLFTSTGIDDYIGKLRQDLSTFDASYTPSKGPRFYVETRRFDLEDPQIKKRFKQLQMQYKLQSTDGSYVINGNNTISTNFGYETIGATAFDYPAGFKIASKFTTATALDITSIKAYLSGLGAGSGSQTFKAMIYSDSGGSPDALLATSSAVIITDGQAAGWVSFPVTYSAAAGTYWLGLIADNADQSAQGHYDSVGTNTYDVIGDAYGDGPSNPFGSGTLLNRKLSIYAVATDSSGADDYAANELTFEIVEGLNNNSHVLEAVWPLTRIVSNSVGYTGFQNVRKKTRSKGSHLGYRLYQNNFTTIKDVQIGPLAIGFKWMRPGKV